MSILKFWKRNKPGGKQIERDMAFINMCLALSKLSKCVSHQVACLLVRDNRIISSGINGTSTGFENCCDKFSKKKFDRAKHHEWSQIFEIHAEMNSILNVAKLGIAIGGSTAYCTLEPCFDCAKNLSMSGVARIVYYKSYDFNTKYRKGRDGYLNKAGVKFEQLRRLKDIKK